MFPWEQNFSRHVLLRLFWDSAQLGLSLMVGAPDINQLNVNCNLELKWQDTESDQDTRIVDMHPPFSRKVNTSQEPINSARHNAHPHVRCEFGQNARE